MKTIKTKSGRRMRRAVRSVVVLLCALLVCVLLAADT